MPIAADLRERAGFAVWSSRWALYAATHPRQHSEWNYPVRKSITAARRALALLAAADRYDALTGTVSDGLHYADGQLFNVQNGRPEAL